MNDELGKIWKEAVVAKWRYYPGICLEGPRKTTKNFRQDSHMSRLRFEPSTSRIQGLNFTPAPACLIVLLLFKKMFLPLSNMSLRLLERIWTSANHRGAQSRSEIMSCAICALPIVIPPTAPYTCGLNTDSVVK
jgi:hypothetical protein